ncbi:MAG: hypothetical protein A2Z60_00070 [Nitrospirae bacterium RIFCSPLOWO2_02_42_7]|nr:MAG: hypothetical protein A2Z60_00070 [Nitrospirae bacterium RIFCSPLOWO2_02_42_7]
MTEFGKILFPTDFSESAENASRYALSLAKKYGSKVYVIHVIEPFTYTTEFGLDFSAQLKEMEASARRLLDDVAASIKKTNLDVESVLITGEPFVEIIKYARKEQVDLIVMATHGRSGIEHMLMGSVAEKVVRKSPCPVLTIKKSGQTFTMP